MFFRTLIALGLMASSAVSVAFSLTQEMKELPSPTIVSKRAGESRANRSFYMATTPYEYDWTPAATEETYKLMDKITDMNVIHLDEGVPWPEVAEKKPYHSKVEQFLKLRGERKHPQRKTYLSVRIVDEEGLVGHWGKDSQLPRKGRWKDKRIDDPEAIAVYTDFLRDLIRRLQPGFLNYAIEANMLAKKDPAKWAQFVGLARSVYGSLKKEHPDLSIFISIQIDDYWKDETNQRQAIQQVLPFTDYIAVSMYPYFFGYFDPHKIPRDYFSRVAVLAPGKPFAVAETGFIAEPIDALGVKGPGTEAWQNDYTEFLLKESQRLQARFVIWFVSRDYDRLWKKIRFFKLINPKIEMFKVWRDSGLLDGDGKPRKAYQTWMRWLNMPRQ